MFRVPLPLPLPPPCRRPPRLLLLVTAVDVLAPCIRFYASLNFCVFLLDLLLYALPSVFGQTYFHGMQGWAGSLSVFV